MYDDSPRIKKILSQEQRNQIVKLKSYKAISIFWEGADVFLNEKSPYFVEDSRTLHDMGFLLVDGTKNKFEKRIQK